MAEIFRQFSDSFDVEGELGATDADGWTHQASYPLAIVTQGEVRGANTTNDIYRISRSIGHDGARVTAARGQVCWARVTGLDESDATHVNLQLHMGDNGERYELTLSSRGVGCYYKYEDGTTGYGTQLHPQNGSIPAQIGQWWQFKSEENGLRATYGSTEETRDENLGFFVDGGARPEALELTTGVPGVLMRGEPGTAGIAAIDDYRCGVERQDVELLTARNQDGIVTSFNYIAHNMSWTITGHSLDNIDTLELVNPDIGYRLDISNLINTTSYGLLEMSGIDLFNTRLAPTLLFSPTNGGVVTHLVVNGKAADGTTPVEHQINVRMGINFDEYPAGVSEAFWEVSSYDNTLGILRNIQQTKAPGDVFILPLRIYFSNANCTVPGNTGTLLADAGPHWVIDPFVPNGTPATIYHWSVTDATWEADTIYIHQEEGVAVPPRWTGTPNPPDAIIGATYAPYDLSRFLEGDRPLTITVDPTGGNLPDGLVINSGAGYENNEHITGVPTQVGPFNNIRLIASKPSV